MQSGDEEDGVLQVGEEGEDSRDYGASLQQAAGTPLHASAVDLASIGVR